MTEKAKNDLKKSLDRFGLIDKPIVNTDCTIIGGHQRVHILSEQGIDEIECWVPSRPLTEKQIEELNIRLNKNKGDWDWELMANDWDIDDLCEWGFTAKELGMGSDTEIDADEKIDVPSEPELVVCPNCGHKVK